MNQSPEYFNVILPETPQDSVVGSVNGFFHYHLWAIIIFIIILAILWWFYRKHSAKSVVTFKEPSYDEEDTEEFNG
jgi:hypothetical protein